MVKYFNIILKLKKYQVCYNNAMEIKEKLKNELKDLKENEPLAPYTTFKIGGPARYFFVAKTSDDLVKAVKIVLKLKIPYYILGGGSNLLISNEGFNGLVIKCQMSNVKCQNNQIVAESGVPLSTVVGKSIEAGLTGLEWAAGIYGTIGGAVRGNAGAFGHSISEAVEEIRSINYEGRIMKFNNKKCQFGYRDSIFKKTKDIILEVVLKLEKGDRGKSKELVAGYLKQRKEKQPLEYPSAGSIFKNIEIKNLSQSELERLNPPKEFIEKRKIPAAWLIDKLDLRGKKIGGAKISEKHANFIINTGNATADNVLALISLIKMKVRDELGIQLEEEIEYLGF